MSVFSDAQKLLLLAVLTALMAGALMYEVLHPTLFPLLKQGILQLLYHIPVFTQPGATDKTRIPYGDSSRAMAWVSILTPPLLA